jgi:hypothetical protein
MRLCGLELDFHIISCWQVAFGCVGMHRSRVSGAIPAERKQRETARIRTSYSLNGTITPSNDTIQTGPYNRKKTSHHRLLGFVANHRGVVTAPALFKLRIFPAASLAYTNFKVLRCKSHALVAQAEIPEQDNRARHGATALYVPGNTAVIRGVQYFGLTCSNDQEVSE